MTDDEKRLDKVLKTVRFELDAMKETLSDDQRIWFNQRIDDQCRNQSEHLIPGSPKQQSLYLWFESMKIPRTDD